MTFVCNLKLVRTNKPGPARCWAITLRDKKAHCPLAKGEKQHQTIVFGFRSERVCLLTQPKSKFPTTVFRPSTVNLFDNASIFDEFLTRRRTGSKQPFQLIVQSH